VAALSANLPQNLVITVEDNN